MMKWLAVGGWPLAQHPCAPRHSHIRMHQRLMGVHQTLLSSDRWAVTR